MANKPSPAALAIKDMLESGVKAVLFIGEINKLHQLNAAIGIITKDAEPTVKVKVEVKVEVTVKVHNYMPPEALKPAPRRIIRFNPDGTVALGDEWDRD